MWIAPDTQLELMGQMKAQETAITQSWAVACASAWTRSSGPQLPGVLFLQVKIWMPPLAGPPTCCVCG